MSFDFPLEDCSEFGNFAITLINPLHLYCFILAYITHVTVYPISDLGEGKPCGSTDKEGCYEEPWLKRKNT